MNFIKKLLQTKLIKVFSFSSLSTLVRMLTSFVSVKVIAVLVGPSGIALVGQLTNFSTIILTFATAGISGGITKYVSEFKEEKTTLDFYIYDSLKLLIICTGICTIFLLIFSSFLSEKILLSREYGYVFVIFGVTLFFYSINTYLLAVINGFQNYRLYIFISIISCIVGLGLSLLLVFMLGTKGALINVVTSQSLTSWITIICVRKRNEYKIKWNKIITRFGSHTVKNLLKFSLMTFISVFGLPVGQLLIRTYVINKYGLNDAGCWEGINKLSNMYLSIITTSFSLYYLPRFSEIKEVKDMRKEILFAYKFIVPFLLILFVSIFLMKNVIIKILFSEEFFSMRSLFIWQLLGDFFKICSWLLVYLLSAKAKLLNYLLLEIPFSILFILFSYFCSEWFGITGVVMGYFVNYLTYFGVTYFTIWRRLEKYV